MCSLETYPVYKEITKERCLIQLCWEGRGMERVRITRLLRHPISPISNLPPPHQFLFVDFIHLENRLPKLINAGRLVDEE